MMNFDGRKRGTTVCVWREREEAVCGKKERGKWENGLMGKIGIFGVCGKK